MIPLIIIFFIFFLLVFTAGATLVGLQKIRFFTVDRSTSGPNCCRFCRIRTASNRAGTAACPRAEKRKLLNAKPQSCSISPSFHFRVLKLDKNGNRPELKERLYKKITGVYLI